jgi:hypothetical protein
MGNTKTYMEKKISEINEARKRNIILSCEEIDNEIKFWETIKNNNYSEKSELFKKIYIDKILRELKKAKHDNENAISPVEIDYEMHFWEALKNCGFSGLIESFENKIDIDKFLNQLNEEKLEKKNFELNASAFCIYYLSEEEKRKIEEKKKI